MSCDALFLWKLDDICTSPKSEASDSVMRQTQESPQDMETPLPQIGEEKDNEGIQLAGAG